MVFANRFRSRFKLGSTTNVYYNPSNPKSAVLIVGLRSYHLVNIAFVVLFRLCTVTE
ncbi:DUF3592 domain-containing protein [Candidatus Reidiella endopervernicosa]|uniref:DUF3592 domain-containing protein n=1 Tax=Candidatus Reidiella endopervernicosa TaxID=2738883 RepID=UPI003B968F1C